MSPKLHSATFYVQLEAIRGYWDDINTGEKTITGAKAVAITQTRPNKPRAGAVLIKLTVDLPEAAFLPLRPAEAIITIPAAFTDLTPILVEALDPNGDEYEKD